MPFGNQRKNGLFSCVLGITVCLLFLLYLDLLTFENWLSGNSLVGYNKKQPFFDLPWFSIDQEFEMGSAGQLCLRSLLLLHSEGVWNSRG